MERHQSSIRALPLEAVSQIKSSTVITNLTGVIAELLKNSLDADSRSIALTVDFQKGSCTVEDDGCGILPEEFQPGGGLGKLHYTSKYNCGARTYGWKGAFLSSLASMALLIITSRHSSSHDANSLVLHHSNVAARFCPAPPQHALGTAGHGTKVAVTDLFGNMPVRVKHRALTLQKQEDWDREWANLKRTITELMLATQGHLKLVVFDALGSRKLVIRGNNSLSAPPRLNQGSNRGSTLDLNHVLAILSRVGYITPNDFGSWLVASVRASGVSVRAAISLQPSPTKQVQFLSFGIHPLHSANANILLNEINQIFVLSTFGSDEFTLESEEGSEGLSGEPNGKSTRPRTKGVNKWPMFVVRIDSDDLRGKPDNGELPSEASFRHILEITCAMFRQFLEQHDFSLPKHRPGVKRDPNVPRSASAAENPPSQRPQSCIPAFPNACRKSKGGLNGDSRVLEPFSPQTRLPATGFAGQRPRVDFGSWSRIKSGTGEFWDDVYSGLPRGKCVQGKSVGEKSQSLPGNSRFEGSVSAPPDGQMRETFDLETTHAGPRNAQQQERQPRPTEEFGASADETITWTDPATKKVISVNKRTGQTLPRIKDQPSAVNGEPRRRSCSSGGLAAAGSVEFQESLRTTAWLNTLLKEWVNPVFPQPERPLPSATLDVPRNSLGESLRGPTEKDFSPSSANFSGRFTKEALRNCQVLSQVDSKFLLVKMTAVGGEHDFEDVLVLVDQHAADERCRVEQLFGELCGSSRSDGVDHTFLAKPISFRVTNQEAQLFESSFEYFGSWGCTYSVKKDRKRMPAVQITTLPTLVAERCRLEPKLAIDMLRSELWSQHDNYKRHLFTTVRPADENTGSAESSTESALSIQEAWLQRIGNCPKGIIDLLNSRACRTAIMFNDSLSLDECNGLIARLAECAFPFQCAHGRPTMVPIVNLQSPGTRTSAPTFSGADSDWQIPLAANAGYSTDFMSTFEAWAAKLADS